MVCLHCLTTLIMFIILFYHTYIRHRERSKLIHCIHLQQVELSERTSAGIYTNIMNTELINN